MNSIDGLWQLFPPPYRKVFFLWHPLKFNRFNQYRKYQNQIISHLTSIDIVSKLNPILTQPKFYCITIFHSNFYSNDRKAIKKFYYAELDCDLDARISELRCTDSLPTCIFHDDNHFIHNFLERIPSARLRTHGVQASIGNEFFVGNSSRMWTKKLFSVLSSA